MCNQVLPRLSEETDNTRLGGVNLPLTCLAGSYFFLSLASGSVRMCVRLACVDRGSHQGESASDEQQSFVQFGHNSHCMQPVIEPCYTLWHTGF